MSTGASSGGTVQNDCPEKAGSDYSTYPTQALLSFPAPKAVPTGRGSFANSSGLPTGITTAIKKAMGQGWPPFSDFDLLVNYDKGNRNFAYVDVGDAPGYHGRVQPGSGVVHKTSKGWILAAGLGMAYPCDQLPNAVIDALGLNPADVSTCTSGGIGSFGAAAAQSESTSTTTTTSSTSGEGSGNAGGGGANNGGGGSGVNEPSTTTTSPPSTTTTTYLVTVPNVVGETASQGQSTMASAGLVGRPEMYETSVCQVPIPSGASEVVTSESPGAGSEVPNGSTVDLNDCDQE